MATTVGRRGVRPRIVDVALFLTVTGTVSVVVAADQASSRPAGPLPYLWALGLGSLMMLRRQAPVPVLIITAFGYYSYYAAGFPAIGVAVPVAAALYSAAEARHTIAAVITGGVVLVGSTGYRLAADQPVAFVVGYDLVSHTALIAAVIGLGYSVQARREISERSRRLADLVARESVLQTDARAREQRLALARDLHDSIGHALSVASLFTGVARDRYSRSSADSDDPLDRVRTAITDAMAHLRSTVTVLRSTTAETSVERSLTDLPSLLQGPTLAGYDVDLHFDHDVRADRYVERTVYRLVQEAVTNTLRHSDASRICVRVARDGGDLEIVVGDNGSPRVVADFGHGLSGMQERVRALGGSLVVVAGDDGWRVTSRIPTGGHR